MNDENFLRFVFCTFRFEGFHCWPGAPDEVAFLRDRHRHVFRVRAEARVAHDDRDREFILMKRRLLAWCEQQAKREVDEWTGVVHVDGRALVTWSCERWASELLCAFPYLVAVTVSEDGENGATVRAPTR